MNDQTLIAVIGGLLLTLFFLWLRADGVTDQQCGIERGRITNPTLPDLMATQCPRCRRIRCIDRQWRKESEIALPVACRVSYTLCPDCGPETLTVARNASSDSDVAVWKQPPKLRPVMAGAEPFL